MITAGGNSAGRQARRRFRAVCAALDRQAPSWQPFTAKAGHCMPKSDHTVTGIAAFKSRAQDRETTFAERPGSAAANHTIQHAANHA